eukprot:SAG11_NODE_2014_length_3922_cov_1.929898_4_plen_184_part_00
MQVLSKRTSATSWQRQVRVTLALSRPLAARRAPWRCGTILRGKALSPVKVPTQRSSPACRCRELHTAPLACRAVAGEGAPSPAGSAASEDAAAAPPGGELVIYEGERARPLRLLKTLSVANCAASLLASPLLATADMAIPLGARLGIAATAVTFGVSTTGFLAWLSKPYLLRMGPPPALSALL